MVIGQKIVRAGSKQVFLPSHLVTMLRPKSNTPPTMATFRVPLTFNKLDLRDYLLNAYNVETAGIRSHVVAQPLEQPEMGQKGRVRRPRSIKYMIVELVKPFVWPAEPADASAWQHPNGMQQAMENQEKQQKLQKQMQKTGNVPLRDEMAMPLEERHLRDQAQQLLREGGWDNRRRVDPRFEKTGRR